MRYGTWLVLMIVVVAAAPLPAATETTATPTEKCSFPVTMTDATGAEIHLDSSPERVVTLNPSAAQTMWEIGARDRVVGVTKHAMNLEGVETRTNISGAGKTINIEEVVGVKPDLVLAPGATSNETVEKLRSAGVTVYRFPDAESLEHVYEKVQIIGRLVGACEGANATVASMQQRITAVRQAVADEPKPRVLYTFFGFTAGKGTFIHTILETAGGDNIAANAGIEGYAKLNSEVIVKRNPEWIVLNSDSATVPANSAYNKTTAIQEGNVVVVPIEYLNRPAPRVVRAITMLAKAFHPTAMAEANLSNTTIGPAPLGNDTQTTTTADETSTTTKTTATTTATDGTTATPESMTTEATPATGPGFGLVSTLVALVVLFVWRRAP